METPPPGYYHISASSSTHRQLLLRMSQDNCNYDILVQGVNRVCLDFTFEVKTIETRPLPGENCFEIYFDNLSRRNMVIASRLQFQVNELGGQESSIPIHLEGPISFDELRYLAQGNNAQEYADAWEEEWEEWIEIPLS